MDAKIILVICSSLFILFVLLYLFRIVYLHQKKQNEFKLEKSLIQSRHQQAILQAQLEIQEQTLNYISQEIHDNIGQVLTLAKININLISVTSLEQEKLDNTKNLVSKAIDDLRSLSRSMQGSKIQELGITEAISYELAQIKKTGLIQTSLKIDGTVYKMEAQKEMVLFRIVQEALGNVVKHANANMVTVSVSFLPNVFTIIVEDNGQGFDFTKSDPAKTGIGISNMKNRAALIGANLEIISLQNLGTKISIEMIKIA